MYEQNNKPANKDNKFKEFSYLIRNCKEGCNGRGYTFEIKKDAKGLVEGTKAIECKCIKKVYEHATFKESNIPSEYWNLSIKDFFIKNKTSEEIKKTMITVHSDINNFVRSGYGMFFYGGPGTGKSLLAIETLKKAIRNELTGYYDWFPTIIEAFRKKGFTADPEKERYSKIFASKDVLVLDEIGKERPDTNNFNSEDIKTFLEVEILKRRSNKTTILISNIENVSDIKTKYGVYVESVLRPKFKIINLEGTDFRTEGDINQFFSSKKEIKNG